MHLYLFHIGDYASHTRHLTPMEDLAYRRMLDLYYLREHPLSDCSTSVARSIGLRDHEAEVTTVLQEFFTYTDDGWRNQRADEEIAKYQGKVRAASRAGKASAAQRALSARSADVQQTVNHKPVTKNRVPVPSNKAATASPEIDPYFLEFWNVYAKKVDKPVALRAWRRLSRSEQRTALEATGAYVASTPDKQYRKNPAVWLRARGWENEIVEPTDKRPAHQVKQDKLNRVNAPREVGDIPF